MRKSKHNATRSFHICNRPFAAGLNDPARFEVGVTMGGHTVLPCQLKAIKKVGKWCYANQCA